MSPTEPDPMIDGYRPEAVDFLIMGPVEVVADGTRLEITGPKERAVLAVLAAWAGQLVTTDRLVDALWGDDPPRSSGKVVQNLVLRLRKTLGPELIETRPGGYALRAEPGTVDAQRFDQLVARGRTLAANVEPGAAAALSGALDLWRSSPLPELADWPPAQAEAARLEELRRCVAEELADVELSFGRHGEWVARLETMVAEEPLRERRWATLMLALYRCGRQADSLRGISGPAPVLAELGLEPGPELRELEHAVSVQDDSLTTPEIERSRALPTGVVSFLLTDIEGSTPLWERSPGAMSAAVDRHDELIARAVTAAGGVVLKARGEGDSSFSVFTKTTAAVHAALAIQEAFDAETWPVRRDPRRAHGGPHRRGARARRRLLRPDREPGRPASRAGRRRAAPALRGRRRRSCATSCPRAGISSSSANRH